MKARLEPKFQSVIRIAFLTIIFLVVGPTSAVEAVQPGFVMFSREFIESFQPDSSDPPEMGAPSSDPVDTEIIELARGLKYDPDLMYQFVHDKIEFKPFFSLFKGPYMTLMDRSGTVFDQAALLIALLKEAGYSDAGFVKGKIQLSTAEMADWFGTSPDPDVILDEFLLLVHFGFSIHTGAGYCSYDSGSDTFTLSHVWVKVNIDGTDYVYDPSMKSHISTAGIDLQSAMQYQRNVFLDEYRQESILYGANIQADFLQNLNTSNLASDLSRYSNNLINYIKTNNAGATLDDIIGGLEIVPAPEPITRLTELPYEFPDPLKVEFGMDDMPEYYKCYIRIEHCGLTDSKRYYTSDIYGRRLTLFYNDDGSDNVYPVIYLDGIQQDSGTSVVRHTGLPITLYYHLVGLELIGIPGLPNSSNVRAGGSYFIVNNWADTGTKIIEKHRKTLQQNRYGGLYSESDEPVLGESLAIMAFTWLAESSRIEQIIGSIFGNYVSSFITIGICGQGGQGGPSTSPFLDLHGVEININHSGDSVKKWASFLAGAGHGSGFEGGVIEQLQPSRSAVSTVKLLDKSNSNGHKIFDATEANWDSIKNEIKDYSEGLKQSIDDLINHPTSNYRVILPEYGNLNEVAWTGGCYLAKTTPVGGLVYGIGGGYKGGYSGSPDPIDVPEFIYSVPIDPVEPSSDNNPQTKEPIDLLTGNYIYENTDLTIGSEYPFGLEFRRYYNSGSRLEDGSLGLGWSHNFDITAKVSSDGFQSMGIDSPIDAAASIVVAYIDMDLLTAEESLTNIMVVSLSQKWLMDQMIDNIVTIKQPGNTMQFVKLPDGTYNPPPGRADELILNNPGPDEYFSLKGKQGDVAEFNAEGLISNWSDSHNNTVTFQYEQYSNVVPGDYSYLNDYLVSHWKLDETEGTAAQDSVGDNDGTLYGDATWDPDGGKFGGAIELDGDYDFVKVPYDSSLAPSSEQFTLSLWAKRDNPMRQYDGGVGMCQELFSYYGNRTAYEIEFHYWSGEVRTQARIEGLTIIYPVENPDTDWHMWSMTVDKADNEKYALHMDGIEVVPGTYQSNINYGNWPLYIGGSPDYSSDGPIDLDGSIDDVMFFNKVLYPSEFAAIYFGRDKPQTVDKYRLINVSNNFGRSLTFAYVGNESHITKVTDSAGRYVLYNYDINGKGMLTEFKDVEEKDTTFIYGLDGQLTEVKYPNDPVNPFVTNTYDSLGRVEQQTNANGYIYDYYYSYYRTEELEPIQTPPAEPPPPPPGDPPQPQRFSKIYYFDDYGNMVAQKDQLGRETIYEYDGQQRRVRVVPPTGNSTEYSYDGNHNVTAIIQKPIQGSSEPDITEGFSYIDHESTAGRWFNQLKMHTDTADNVTTYEYDYESGPGEVGDLKEIIYPAVDLPDGSGTFSPKTRFTYNSYGQVLTETKDITNTDSTTTSYEYYAPDDDPGYGGLKKTTVDYGGLDVVTQMEYDTVGNVKTIVDPRGNETKHEYYPSRRLKIETSPAPFNYKTYYEYYPDGKLKLVKRQTEDTYAWQTTTYTYTPSGQKETVQGPIIGGNFEEDIVGGNHGINFGAQKTIGQVGGALEFDGVADYVDVPDFAGSFTELTVSCWVNINEYVSYRKIVDFGGLGTGRRFTLQAFSGNKIQFCLDGINGSASWISNLSGWIHLAGTWSGTDYIRLYVNGEKEGDNSTPPVIQSLVIESNDSKKIGRRIKAYDGTDTYDYFNGIIDEVMIFDRALPRAEIQQVYQNGVGGVNALIGFDPAEYPVSYWNFKEEGDTVYDVVGGNHGINYGAQETIGQVGNALEFDGVDDYVDVPDFAGEFTELTVSCWVNINEYPVYRKIVDFGATEPGAEKNRRFTVHAYQYEGDNRVQVCLDGGPHGSASWTSTLSDWIHLVGTWSGTDYIRLYVNGEKKGDNDTSPIFPSLEIKSDDGKYFGRRATAATDYFNGTIDEVMIFDRALPLEEIQQVYQNGVGGVNALTGLDPAEYPVSYWNFDQCLANFTRYEYDSLDRLWKVTDGENNTTEQLYYPDGKLCKIVDARNSSSVTNIYNPDGTLYSMKDARGNVTTYQYDDHIRLKKTTYPDPTKYEELGYDGAGRLKDKRTRAGEIIEYSYDELNRLQTRKVPPNTEIIYKYDLLSRQVEIVETITGGDTTIIYNEFDKVGRLKGVTYDYPSIDNKIVQYEYDAAGNRTKLTYPDDGKYARYHYDNLNRLVSIYSDDDIIAHWGFDEGEGDIVYDAVGGNHGVNYGAQETIGQVGSALEFDGVVDYVDVPDFAGSFTELTVSCWVNINEYADHRKIVDFGSESGGGRRFTLQAFSGNKIQFCLDGINGSATWTSNLSGWIHLAGTWSGTDYIRLYVNGEKEGDNSTPPVIQSLVIESNDSKKIGRRIKAYDGTDTYDYFNGTIDEVMIFDRALQDGEVQQVYQNGGAVVSYAYDDLSARVSARYGNGTNAEYYYDMADRLLGLDNQTNNGNLSYDYGYDNANNRVAMLVNGTDSHRYTYDEIYQLINVDYPEDFFTDDTSLTYDPAGNRWEVIGGGLGPNYSTNVLNQYINAGTVYFSYDDNGNLTGDGTYSYTYDAENRLIAANATELSITYDYDPLGRRISKTDGGVTTYYIYDGDQVICEYDDAGNLRKRFIYGAGIDEVVRMSHVGRTADITSDGNVNIYDLHAMAAAWLTNEGDVGFDPAADLNYDGKINNVDSDILSANWLANNQLSEVHFYYHYDGLGSVIALSDSTGRVVEKYQYAVYGNPRIMNQNDKQLTESKYGNPYMFTGRRFDTKTRLYYYRARYYSTEIGRFLQVDPIGYEGSMNLYIYVGNNPVILVDPFGLDWFDSFANFWAGAADSLSFGLTGLARKAIRVDSVVDRSSVAYKAGEYTEIAVEVGATLGSAALKTAAKKTGQKAARKAVRGATRHVARRGKMLHHINPLFGHPGGRKALFPMGGLPSAIHSSRWNLQLMDDLAHLAAHRRLRYLEQGLKTIFHPSMTGARTARNLITDFMDTSDLIYDTSNYSMDGTGSYK